MPPRHGGAGTGGAAAGVVRRGIDPGTGGLVSRRFGPNPSIRPALVRINEGPISLRHCRLMSLIALVACPTGSARTAAMARFGAIARAIPWLVGVILANPECTLADVAFFGQLFIVPPTMFPTARQMMIGGRAFSISLSAGAKMRH